jgi:nicotinate-nucleotide--dimethylbenzimidazole phosphoribosyltransferase
MQLDDGTYDAATEPTAIDTIAALRARVTPPAAAEAAAIRTRLDALAKPPGSLGALERVALELARISGDPPPPLTRRRILVFAADHGVARRGVSAYPADVTAQMCGLFVAGGAAINVIARSVGAEVTVIDVGVEAPADALRGVLARKVRRGTRDLAEGPALTHDEVDRAVAIGFECASAAAGDADILALGDMGIGNTTAAAAVTAALTGAAVADVVGRGTGIDDDRLRLKRDIVARAVARARASSALEQDRRPAGEAFPEPRSAAGGGRGERYARHVLAEVGGLEIAAIAGATLGAAAAGKPVVTDGFIATAGVLAAVHMCPDARGYVFASHRSAEPGHDVQLAALGLMPLLDLGMRLGEGSGAALALPILDAAGAVLREMATLADIGIAGPAARDAAPGLTPAP